MLRFSVLAIITLIVIILDGTRHDAHRAAADAFGLVAMSIDAPANPSQGAIVPASAGSPGHVDAIGMLRDPASPWGPRLIADRVFFQRDEAGGTIIWVSEAHEHDRWIWTYFAPDEPTTPYDSCWFEILPPGDPSNPSSDTALIAFCGPSAPVVMDSFPAGCPCTPDIGFAGALPIFNTPVEDQLGTWTVHLDFEEAGTSEVTALQQDVMHLTYTPAVLLTHGYDDNCNNFNAFDDLLAEELGVPFSTASGGSTRIRCFEYDFRKGVDPAAIRMAHAVRDFRSDLGLADDAEVDLVGHSLGGLVIRYYYQFRYGSPDGPVGSLSMLGTPNDGVEIARWEKAISAGCAVLIFGCAIIDWADLEDDIPIIAFDPDSQGVDDLKPGSAVLNRLNREFMVPDSPQYRVHIGHNNEIPGTNWTVPGDNDCVVAATSADGPGNPSIFSTVLRDYPEASHDTIIWCSQPTLVNFRPVAANVSLDIKLGPHTPTGSPNSQLPSTFTDALEPGGDLAISQARLASAVPAEHDVHVVDVPSGVPVVRFVVAWLDEELEPSLGLILRRPEGQPVAGSDSDVLGVLDAVGDTPLNILQRGFAMALPAAGQWTVEVTGDSVPEGGIPYIVLLLEDSGVQLAAEVSADRLPAGQAVLITSSLFDGAAAVSASSVTGEYFSSSGTQGTLTLNDAGTDGDAVAGDLIYSTLLTVPDCGRNSVTLTASGNTSEGTVTRQQIASFSTTVAGDAVRDPCDPDEDNDGLTDEFELNTSVTDPMDRDMDDDGVLDGAELAQGTDPTDPDTDGDGFADRPQLLQVGLNTDTSADNCPTIANPLQVNTDAAALSNGPNIPGEDSTILYGDALGDACDLDDDNDGLLDVVEAELAPCPSASGPLDPLDMDTDGDHLTDGWECANGSDPNDPLSKFLGSGSEDVDGDRIPDLWERRGYNANPASTDSDGDGCHDLVEIGDINGDRVAGIADRLAVARRSLGILAPDPAQDYVLDVSKDGTVGIADRLFVARASLLPDWQPKMC